MSQESESHQHYYRELTRQARQTDLISWIQQNRPDLVLRKTGREHTITSMDSIKIRENMWYRHSLKGDTIQGNSIDFLVSICGMSEKEAIIALTGVDLTGNIKSTEWKNRTGHKRKKEKEIGAFDDVFDFSQFDINSLNLHRNQRRVIAYLTKNRGISSTVVINEIREKNLFQLNFRTPKIMNKIQ